MLKHVGGGAGEGMNRLQIRSHQENGIEGNKQEKQYSIQASKN